MKNMNEKNLNELEKVSGGRPAFAVQNDAEIYEIVFPVPGPVPPTPAQVFPPTN